MSHLPLTDWCQILGLVFQSRIIELFVRSLSVKHTISAKAKDVLFHHLPKIIVSGFFWEFNRIHMLANFANKSVLFLLLKFVCIFYLRSYCRNWLIKEVKPFYKSIDQHYFWWIVITYWGDALLNTRKWINITEIGRKSENCFFSFVQNNKTIYSQFISIGSYSADNLFHYLLWDNISQSFNQISDQQALPGGLLQVSVGNEINFNRHWITSLELYSVWISKLWRWNASLLVLVNDFLIEILKNRTL